MSQKKVAVLETALPFQGQTTRICSSLSPKRDCGSTGVKSPLPLDLLHSGDETPGLRDGSCLKLEKVKTDAYIRGAWYITPNIVSCILCQVYASICCSTLPCTWYIPAAFIYIYFYLCFKCASVILYLYVCEYRPRALLVKCDGLWAFELHV